MAKNASGTEDTMDLWNKVCHTNPDSTKETNNGRYDFTAVDPHSQLMAATQVWGPYGTTWGLRNLEFRTEDISHKEVEKRSLVGRGEFFWPDGSFEIVADLPYRWNDDAYKKLFTTMRSKSLSLLGFNADVFMDKFSDEHYVQSMRTMYSDEEVKLNRILSAVNDCQSKADLIKVRKLVGERYDKEVITRGIYSEGLEALENREKELKLHGKKAPVTKPATAEDIHAQPPMSEADKRAALAQEAEQGGLFGE